MLKVRALVLAMGAWLWVACLALTLLTCLPQLDFRVVAHRSLVHSTAWLLAFSGAGYFATRTTNSALGALLRWIPRVQWVLAALPLLMLWYGLFFLYSFFLDFNVTKEGFESGIGSPLLRRGSAVVRYQRIRWQSESDINGTAVIVRPVTQLLEWVTPVGPYKLDSTWTVLDPYGRTLISSRYEQVAQQRKFEHYLGRLQASADSANLVRDALPLPAATQLGTGTIGYAANGKNRQNRLTGRNDQGGTDGIDVHARLNGPLGLDANLGLPAPNNTEWLTIALTNFHGLGTYYLGRRSPLDASFMPTADANYLQLTRLGTDEKNRIYMSVAAQPARLTITHFNAKQNIIAGTFEGTLHSISGDTLRISQGRFDVTL
ncbi:MAG TPA: hypothetical protein VF629_18105 [Hymenobacter sp.]|jgi:hypothetical protein|uniref:hypothetical protein n=1 Tax=Hymenobacter sp. TaxID=1898978 RepID=UPI002EDAE8CF